MIFPFGFGNWVLRRNCTQTRPKPEIVLSVLAPVSHSILAPRTATGGISTAPKRKWSNLMPFVVALVVIAEIAFLGKLDIAKNTAVVDSWANLFSPAPMIQKARHFLELVRNVPWLDGKGKFLMSILIALVELSNPSLQLLFIIPILRMMTRIRLLRRLRVLLKMINKPLAVVMIWS